MKMDLHLQQSEPHLPPLKKSFSESLRRNNAAKEDKKSHSFAVIQSPKVATPKVQQMNNDCMAPYIKEKWKTSGLKSGQRLLNSLKLRKKTAFNMEDRSRWCQVDLFCTN